MQRLCPDTSKSARHNPFEEALEERGPMHHVHPGRASAVARSREEEPQQEFPAPAPDSVLAQASFQPRGRSIQVAGTVESVRSNRYAAALAILGRLDDIAEKTMGVPAISMLLENLGTNKEAAAQGFEDSTKAEGAEARIEDLMREITGVSREALNPYMPDCANGAEDGGRQPSQFDAIAQRVIKAAEKDDISLRDLTINSVTHLTKASRDYHEWKPAVRKEYNDLFEKISAPRAADFFQYAFGGFIEGTKNAGKSVGLFLLRSIITQNIPGFIKNNIPLEYNSPSDEHDQATWWTSTAIAGFANAYIATSIISRCITSPSSPEPYSLAKEIGAWALLTGIGWLIELGLRAPLKLLCPDHSGYSGDSLFQGGYPGWSLLEIACLPFRIIGTGATAIGSFAADMKNRIQEQKTAKFRDKGF